MKKIIYFIFICLVALLIPNVYAADVEIKDIKLSGKSDNTTVLSDPTIDDLEITFDLEFKGEGDFARYEFDVYNNTGEDYEIDNSVVYSESKYIKYEFSFENGDSVLKKNSKKLMYVKITYDKEVPDDQLANGTYIEDKAMTVSLSNVVVNPKTNNKSFVVSIISLIVVLSIGALLLYHGRTKSKYYMILLCLGLLVIPISIYAAKLIKITVNPTIEIDNNYTIYLVHMNDYCSNVTTSNGLLKERGTGLLEYGYFACSNDGHPVDVIRFVGQKTWNELLDAMEEEGVMNEEDFVYFRQDIQNYTYEDSEETTKSKANDLLINDHAYYMDLPR